MDGNQIWNPGSLLKSVGTLSELSSLRLPDAAKETGALVFVRDIAVDAFFYFQLDSGLPVDGVTVLSTSVGGLSRWIKLITGGGGVPGPPTTIFPDDVPNPGISPENARADHRHGITTAAPVTVGTVNLEGVSNDFARADHVHAGTQLAGGADTPTQIDVGDAGLVGVSTVAAKADHQHALPVPPNPTTIFPDDAASPGVATTVARSDHRHQITAGVPVSVGLVNDEGVSTEFSRADHVHAIGALGPSHSVLFWGDQNVGSTTTTRFMTPGFGDSAIASTTAIQMRLPFAAVLKNLRVRQNIAAGNGNLIVYTVRINGVVTALSVSMASTANDGSDLVNTVVFAAGDLIDILITKALAIAASPTNVTAILEIAA